MESSFDLEKSSNAPTISIIVPIYNTEKYLKKCIESICEQSLKTIEIILVDDGSTDKCPKICDYYQKKDKRIIVIHKENGGLSDARNVGLEVASGEYIGFIDGDDYIDKNMFEDMYRYCLLYKADIACCGRYLDNIYTNKTEELFFQEELFCMTGKDALKEMLIGKKLDTSVCDKLFKHKLFKDIKFPLGLLFEDILVTYKLFALAEKVVHLGKCYYHYLICREGSITTSIADIRILQFIENSKIVYEFVNETYEDYKKEAEYFYLNAVYHVNTIALTSKFSKKYPKVYKEIRKYLNENILVELRNPYFSISSKIKYMLIYFNIYTLVKVLENFKIIKK